MPRQPRVPFSTQLRVDIKRRLLEISEAEGKSLRKIIEEALLDWLDQRDAPEADGSTSSGGANELVDAIDALVSAKDRLLRKGGSLEVAKPPETTPGRPRARPRSKSTGHRRRAGETKVYFAPKRRSKDEGGEEMGKATIQ